MEIKQAIKFLEHPQVVRTEPTMWADFGAGSGLFTHALAHLLAPNSSILAVDKNAAAFEPRRSTSTIDIRFLEADFASADFTLNNLDGILMANSLHFVVDKENFLRRCDRYFKQAPCLLIVEYDLVVANQWVPFPIDFKSLSYILKSIGYSLIEKIHEAPSKFNRSNIYSLIAVE